MTRTDSVILLYSITDRKTFKTPRRPEKERLDELKLSVNGLSSVSEIWRVQYVFLAKLQAARYCLEPDDPSVFSKELLSSTHESRYDFFDEELELDFVLQLTTRSC
jgi:hypothetical protein